MLLLANWPYTYFKGQVVVLIVDIAVSLIIYLIINVIVLLALRIVFGLSK